MFTFLLIIVALAIGLLYLLIQNITCIAVFYWLFTVYIPAVRRIMAPANLLALIIAIVLSIPLSIFVGFMGGLLAILFQYPKEVAETALLWYSLISCPILFFFIFRYVKRFLQKRFFSNAEAC